MRWAMGSLVAVVFAFVIYLGSAVVSAGGLINAARSGNAAEVIARTDMDRLKRSLVDQIVEAYLERTGRKKPMERLLANTYGASIADAMLQKILTPENLTKLLQTGLVVGPDNSPLVMPALLSINGGWADLLGRVRPVKLTELAIRTSPTAESETYSSASIHFEGDGWKLSGINLPKSVTRQLASTLPLK